MAFLILLISSIAGHAKAATPTFSHQDIGTVGATGSYSVSGSLATLKGSGDDIWNSADAFRFAYQPLVGDGSLTIRVNSQTNTNPWAKAGVMFRETLTANSPHVTIALTPSNGAVVLARATKGATSTSIHGPMVKAPYWVRMVRAGNVLTGYISSTGASWTSIGSYTVKMTSQIYVGVAVTSHVAGTLSTATFDNPNATSTPGTATETTSVSVAPAAVVVAPYNWVQFSASVTGSSNQGVTWLVNGVVGGNTTVGTITASGLYKGPAFAPAPNTVTVTAKSVADSTRSATAAVTITSSALPTISGAPSTNAAVGQAYSFTPTATSPSGAKLTFAITNKPAWATFSTTTGQLTGTPASGDIGTFANVSISATDGTTNVTLPAFTITVNGSTTGSATLSWTAPTTRSDGTTLTNLAGYRIYYGTASGNYTKVITVANPGVTSYVVDNLPAATYYFVCAAYDAKSIESTYSAQVSKVIR